MPRPRLFGRPREAGEGSADAQAVEVRGEVVRIRGEGVRVAGTAGVVRGF